MQRRRILQFLIISIKLVSNNQFFSVLIVLVILYVRILYIYLHTCRRYILSYQSVSIVRPYLDEFHSIVSEIFFPLRQNNLTLQIRIYLKIPTDNRATSHDNSPDLSIFRSVIYFSNLELIVLHLFEFFYLKTFFLFIFFFQLLFERTPIFFC